jgi:hypothetical protein
MKTAVAAVALMLGSLSSETVLAQDAPKLVFQFDTVRGAGPTAQGPGCVLNSQFKRKEAVIWRVRIVDPKTGKDVDDKGVKSLHIELSNGEKVPMSFHGHPPKDSTDHFWSGGWIVPEDHPTGSFGYTIVATGADGALTKMKPFNVAGSQLTVVGN